MKKILLAVLTLGMFTAQAQTSDLSVENGTLKFSSIDIYESYADNPSNLSSIQARATSSPAVTTLKEVGVTSDEDIPEFLQSVLNSDNIFTIGSYLIKIDVVNNRALVINSSVANAYTDLVNNNTSSANMLMMSDDEQNALEVLRAIDGATLTVNDYKTATPEISLRWPWNRCNGARGGASQKNVDVWDKAVDKSSDCPDLSVLYGADNKIVYQKFIFYFSLQAKMKSLRGCSSTNWILVPTHDALLKLDGTVRYVKVNACRSETNDSRNDGYQGNEINWRAYSGSRALSKYDFTVDFRIKHTWETGAYHGPFHYNIMYGY